MNKSIKFLTLIISVTMSLSILSGCGNKNSSGNGTGSDKNTTSDAKPGNPTLPIVSKPTTLKVWAPIGSDVTSLFKNYNETEYYKELEKRTGVHVEFIHPAVGQEVSALNLLFASSDYPDIIQVVPEASMNYPGGVDKGISDGVFIKLNDLVDKYAPNYKALINSSAEIKKDSMTDSGYIKGFDEISKTIQPAWFGQVVRQDWLDDLGLKTPVTYDDWYNMLKAFKEKKGAVAPLMLNYTGFQNFDGLNAGYGVGSSFYNVNGKVKFGPLEEGYKEYITMLNKWYKDGLIDKDFTTRKDFVPTTTYTTTGKAGAWSDVYLLLSVDKAQSKDKNFRAVAVPSPVKNAGDQVHLRQANHNAKNVFWTITKNCKDPVTAVKWIDYNYSPDGALLANYGFEGKTFTKDSNGKPQYNEFMYKNPDGLSLDQAMVKYSKSPSVGAYEYSWERELAGQPKDNLDAGTIWGQNNDGSYVLPILSMSTDEGTEYAAIMGDINTYISEMDIKFIIGNEPLSKYDDFVKQIKSMNIDKAMQIQQAALDRYNARK